jgi:excisionase family DNA binding protein
MPSSTFMSIADAAADCGLSVKTIRRRIADGTLPGYRPPRSRAIRVKRSDVEKLMRPIPTTGRAS